MKTYTFAVLAACSLALTAPCARTFAQAPPPPPMHGPMMGGPMHGPMGGGGRMQRMGDELGLTAAQKAKMQPLLMNFRQQMMTLQSNTALTPAARMAKMQSMGKTMNAQMMAILTPAQRTKLQAMRQQMRQGRQMRPGQPGG